MTHRHCAQSPPHAARSWRYRSGGVHLDLGVDPDIVVYAKAMSNGYPIAAIIGTDTVMEAAQDCFVSSTYWTEALGPVAALATIAEYERVRPWSHFKQAGARVVAVWKEAGRRHELPISLRSTGPLSSFSFQGGEANVAKTLFTQCMLERGFLASTAFYASLAHTDEGIDSYAHACDEVFGVIKAASVSGSLHAALRGPEAHTGFTRLN